MRKISQLHAISEPITGSEPGLHFPLEFSKHFLKTHLFQPVHCNITFQYFPLKPRNYHKPSKLKNTIIVHVSEMSLATLAKRLVILHAINMIA